MAVEIRERKEEFTAEEIRVAVCGNLRTACEELQKEGIENIDTYADASSLAFKIRQGIPYHLILVYAPEGEGLLDTSYPYKVQNNQEWKQVPVRLLNEPACQSALLELKRTIRKIRNNME
ncbi:MAG: hypothetical protein IKW28_00610 [Lachnospiraceae bacterium]|nr:hypothetical protein [Lachnospiraceae bacterium]